MSSTHRGIRRQDPVVVRIVIGRVSRINLLEKGKRTSFSLTRAKAEGEDDLSRGTRSKPYQHQFADDNTPCMSLPQDQTRVTHIFDQGQQRKRPNDRTDPPNHILLIRCRTLGAPQRCQHIQRTRTDIAIDDPQGGKGECEKLSSAYSEGSAGFVSWRRVDGGHGGRKMTRAGCCDDEGVRNSC